jgi:hypothetical protein
MREVDFLITKNASPWILVEAKNSSNNSLSSSLSFFQKELSVCFVFQVSNTDEYVNTSCFDNQGIWMVPAKTFLSQLA